MVLNMEITETNELLDQEKEKTTGTYWSNNTNNTAKPKFTYDDILSSLNLEVSKNGVLQRMSIKSDNNVGNNNNTNIKQIQNINNSKVEPEVKHSYIYNKYFKNYKDSVEAIVPRIPKTREEYRQMVMEDLINRQKAKQRIAQIKSTKMLYTNNNNFYTSAPTNINRNNLNKLFRIK
jgi:hypothetical protein